MGNGSGKLKPKRCRWLVKFLQIGSSDEVCLRFEYSERPWYDAVAKCGDYGGDLVHIFDETEQTYFTDYLAEKGRITNCESNHCTNIYRFGTHPMTFNMT